jgi:hypothetical protein
MKNGVELYAGHGPGEAEMLSTICTDHAFRDNGRCPRQLALGEVLMRVLSVEFERLRHTKKQPNHCRFVAETDEALPHGDKGFSGILLHDDLLWKARADVSTTWSKAGVTRKRAVENCVEDTIKSFAEFEAARLRQDAENERQRQQLMERNERLRQYIRAHEVDMCQTEMLNGLSKREIKLFFGVVVESFKREDGRTAEAQSEQRRGRDVGIYGFIAAYHSRKEQPPCTPPDKDILRGPYIPLALRK